MKYNTFVFIFSLISLNVLISTQIYAQDSNEKNLNINETILNRIEGLNTKIVDLERKVYQGKELSTNSQNLNDNKESLNLDDRASHERRLIELEERSRSIEGLIEELNYVRTQVEKLITQNSILESKLDVINSKNITTENNIDNEKLVSEEIIEDYPIYPGMPSKNNNVDSNELNVINEDQGTSTVKVLAKINPDSVSGEDQIIKKNTITKPVQLDIITQKENTSAKKDNSIVTNNNPEEIYQRAYNILSKGDIEAARVAFKAFIKDYPDHTLTSNAYYWLGQTFYVRQYYQNAATTFAEGYLKFPEGSKAADQLFKLAISLDLLKKTTEACATFKKLDEEFPDAPSRISNRAQTYKDKLDCK